VIGIKILVQGVEKIRVALSKNRDNATDRGLAKLSDKIADNIRASAPVKSGRLKASIKSSRVGLMHYEIREGVFYGAIQRSGTIKKGYPIYPRNKMALWWPGLPHPVAYVRSHPGFRANDYVAKGVNKSSGNIENAKVEIMQDYVLVTKE